MNILKLKHLYILGSFFIFALISATGLNKAYAANLDIYCDDVDDGDQCDIINSPSSLFNETGWYPGSTLTKTISVTNDDHDDDCHLIMSTSSPSQTPSNFAAQLNTAVKRKGDKVIYGDLDGVGAATNGLVNSKTLQNIFDGNVDLGIVPQDNGKATYEWTLTFNKDAGNTFADANTNFSLNINFTCEPNGSPSTEKSTHSHSHRSSRSSGNVAGAATGGVTNLLGNVFGGAVAGAETVEQPKPEETPKVSGASTTVPTEAVKGAANKVCEVSGLLWLVFVAQFLLHIVGKFLFKKRRDFYISHLLIMTVFVVIFFFAFCVWWDVLVSLLIGIVALWFIKLFSD